MRDVPELLDGYHRFLDGRYPQEAASVPVARRSGAGAEDDGYRLLRQSRRPGDDFQRQPGPVVRRAQCRQSGAAVRTAWATITAPARRWNSPSPAWRLRPSLVMGHARCGGVRAYLEGHLRTVRPPKTGFIDRWMSLLNEARVEAHARGGGRFAGRTAARRWSTSRSGIRSRTCGPFRSSGNGWPTVGLNCAAPTSTSPTASCSRSTPIPASSPRWTDGR